MRDGEIELWSCPECERMLKRKNTLLVHLAKKHPFLSPRGRSLAIGAARLAAHLRA